MKDRTFYIIVIAVIVFVAATIVVCAPSRLVRPDTEIEDCDADDRRRGEWWECPNVLYSTKAPAAPKPSSKKTSGKTTTRK